MALTDQQALATDLPLRAIHLPNPPGIWPVAFGWWLVAGVLLVAGLLVFLLIRRKRRLRYRRAALAQLVSLEKNAELGPSDLLAELSQLLRRTALTAFPHEHCAGLNGDDWLLFLNRGVDDQAFSAGIGRCLAAGPYQQAPDYDRSGLIQLCRLWLKNLPPVPKKGRL